LYNLAFAAVWSVVAVGLNLYRPYARPDQQTQIDWTTWVCIILAGYNFVAAALRAGLRSWFRSRRLSQMSTEHEPPKKVVNPEFRFDDPQSTPSDAIK
jgi:hypothetical protein